MPVDRVTVNYCATVLDLGWRKTRKVLRRLEHMFPPDTEGRYDPRILDVLRALRGQPHRELSLVENDWLSRYLKEISNAPTPEGPQEPRPARGDDA